MKNEDRIPQEIIQFFTNPGGHSLIVKGLAGTGKTTFALQLIEQLKATTHSYYLSTRCSDESLFRQFSWFKTLLKRSPGIKIGEEQSRKIHTNKLYESDDIDITLDMSLRSAKHLAKSQEEKERISRDELKKLEGKIEMGEADIFDEKPTGEIDGDTITYELGSDLPEMEAIYDIVEGWKPQKALVIVDSVDALSERYGVGAPRLMSTFQKDLVENSATNLLFVLETGSDTALDYLGDGVVLLSTDEHEGRRIRLMSFEKLRGAEIQHPKYLFTLSDGRLKAFGYRYTEKLKEARKWEYVPDIRNEFVSTGNEDIDHLIGNGLQKGSIIAIEIGANVPYQYTDLLKTGLVCNFVTQKRGVVTVPSMRATSEIVKDVLEPHLSSELFDNYIRIFETTPKVFEVSSIRDTETAKNILPMDGSDVETEMKWSNIEYSLSDAQKPFMSMAGFDTLEAIYGTDVIEPMTDHLTSIRKGGHIFIGFLTPTTKSTQKLASVAHVHIKIENVNGAIVIYAEKPYTELYFLSYMYQLGFPKAHLTPIT